MSSDTALGITGVKKTLAILKEVEPEVYKALNKNIKEALMPTRDRAKGKYPKGGWGVRLNSKKLLGTITATSGTRLDDNWGGSSPGVRAAIFEFAGSNQAGKTPQARGLIKSLNDRYGSPGRFLWSAWDEVGQDALNNIEDYIRQAESKLQSKLDVVSD